MEASGWPCKGAKRLGQLEVYMTVCACVHAFVRVRVFECVCELARAGAGCVSGQQTALSEIQQPDRILVTRSAASPQMDRKHVHSCRVCHQQPTQRTCRACTCIAVAHTRSRILVWFLRESRALAVVRTDRSHQRTNIWCHMYCVNAMNSA